MLLGTCLPLAGATPAGPATSPADDVAVVVPGPDRALHAWGARLTAEGAARADAAVADAVVLAEAATSAALAARDLAVVRPETAPLVGELDAVHRALETGRSALTSVPPVQPVPGPPRPDAGVAVQVVGAGERYRAASELRVVADQAFVLSVRVDRAVQGEGDHAARLAGLAELEAATTTATELAEALPTAGVPAAGGDWVMPVGATQDDPWPNGVIPRAALCAVPFAPEHHLRCDAAEALADLAAAYHAETGRPLRVVSSYRTLAEQVRLRAQKGWLAAPPGTSQHGRGLAVDLADMGALGRFDAPGYLWMTRNAPAFGWFHPAAMEPGGSGPPEPWHWEFIGDDAITPLRGTSPDPAAP